MSTNSSISSTRLLLRFTLIITGFYFLFLGIIEGKAFLAPLAIAATVAILVYPMAKWFEKKGFSKGLASTTCLIILLIGTALLGLVVSVQTKNIMDDWDEIKEELIPKVEQLESFVLEYTPMEKGETQEYKSNIGMGESEEDEQGEPDRQEEQNEDSAKENGEEGEKAISVLGAVFGFMTDFLLTFVYIFLFLHFRRKFKIFILKLFKAERRKEVKDIVEKSAVVVQSYLAGRLFLMVILAVLYAVGLLISGVENFIVVSIIAALLSIIPFIGNMMGFVLALAMALFSGGDIGMIVGVTITFGLVQFLDSYILQPIVLGDKLNVHPVFIILSVLFGNAIWGIAGMILAIPVFAIVTVVARNVPKFEPYGFLFSNDPEADEEDEGE